MAKDILQEVILYAPKAVARPYADQCEQHELILLRRRVLPIILVRAAKHAITAAVKSPEIISRSV